MNRKIDDRKRQLIKEIIHDSIPDANLTGAKVLCFASISVIFVGILYALGLIKGELYLVRFSIFGSCLMMLSASIVTYLKKGNGHYLKYAIFVSLIASIFMLNIMTGYRMLLFFSLPIILTYKYYDKKFLNYIIAITGLLLVVTGFSNAYLYEFVQFIDLNTVSFETDTPAVITGFLFDDIIKLNPDSSTILKNTFETNIFPCFLCLALMYWSSCFLMESNLENIIKIYDLSEKEADQKIELSDLKTKAMLSQIKPHFIYNTLTSIAMLCTKDPAKAKALTIDFSGYLRGNLDTIEMTSDCPFSQELSHIKNYLNIEKVRFEERLNIEYDINETDFTLPVLSIQPLVENAVKHGICKKTEGGTVKLYSGKTDGGYLIKITDDGVGFNADSAEDIGLKSVRKRISMCNGTLTINSTPSKGTEISVYIPGKEVTTND